jgi:choline transport protein
MVPAGKADISTPTRAAAGFTHVTYTPIIWGPWRIPGMLGIANNIFACVYLIFVLFFSLWPSYAAVTPQNMNWSILITGVIAIFSALYYFFWAKRTYEGPVIEVEPTLARNAI